MRPEGRGKMEIINNTTQNDQVGGWPACAFFCTAACVVSLVYTTVALVSYAL